MPLLAIASVTDLIRSSLMSLANLLELFRAYGRGRGKGVSFGLSQGTAGAERGEQPEQPGATIVRKAIHRVTSKDFSIR